MTHFLFTNSQLSGTGFRVNLLGYAWRSGCGSAPYIEFVPENNSSTWDWGCTAPNIVNDIGQWVCYEFKFVAHGDGTGYFGIYRNGILVHEGEGAMTQTNFTKIVFSGYDSPASAFQGDFYIDNIVVADEYIGPLAEGSASVSPSGSPSAEPYRIGPMSRFQNPRKIHPKF
jgi:hypothetical protein